MIKLKTSTKNSNLLGKSLIELKEMISMKALSYKELNDYFLKRIQKYNQELNAFVTVCSEKSHPKGVSGIPIALKDNFCTKGIRTTASSKVLDDFIPPYESTVTQRLLLKGFEILGKTNMDAWAHGSSTETSDYGPTKNPWDLTRSPGGSSGGSAAAVSSYLSPAAIGSETAGSIRQPASWSGIIGLKPTYGRVSRYGVIAMGSSLDCPGTLTLTIKDAAFLLGLIAGKDPYDATSSPLNVPNYLLNLETKKKLIIGITEDYFNDLNNDIKTAVYRYIDISKSLGHRIKKIKLIDPQYAISVYTIIQRAEVSSNLGRYDGVRYGSSRHSFAAEAKRRIMLGTYTLSYGYYDAYYKKAQKVRTLILKNFEDVFKDVDVILSVPVPITALKIGESQKYSFFGEWIDRLNEPAAMAGIPAMSLPCGLDKNNLPIGLQIMGRHFDEATVLNLAYQYEKETDFFGVIKKGVKRYPD